MKTASPFLAWFLRLQGFRAITLPPFGIYAVPGSERDEQLARHETAHWLQYQRMGAARFYVTYLWLLLRHGYWDHPMEVEARQVENRRPTPVGSEHNEHRPT